MISLDAGSSRQVQGFFYIMGQSYTFICIVVLLGKKKLTYHKIFGQSNPYIIIQEYSTHIIIDKLCEFILYDQNCIIV